jgi:hypothetical protein
MYPIPKCFSYLTTMLGEGVLAMKRKISYICSSAALVARPARATTTLLDPTLTGRPLTLTAPDPQLPRLPYGVLDSVSIRVSPSYCQTPTTTRRVATLKIDFAHLLYTLLCKLLYKLLYKPLCKPLRAPR